VLYKAELTGYGVYYGSNKVALNTLPNVRKPKLTYNVQVKNPCFDLVNAPTTSTLKMPDLFIHNIALDAPVDIVPTSLQKYQKPACNKDSTIEV
jgi:hypothetical protein